MASTEPPFKTAIPGLKTIPGNIWQQRTVPAGISDGSSARWPAQPPYRGSDSRVYLAKVADEWAKRDGSARPGESVSALCNNYETVAKSATGYSYYLDRLPDGYACFEIDQPSGQQVYKRLFGHPSGRFYDSIVRFQTHFFWLIEGRQGKCQCVLCGNWKPPPGPPRQRNRLDPVDRMLLNQGSTSKPTRPARLRAETSGDDASSRSESVDESRRDRRRPARNANAAYPVDEEGTANEYKKAVIQLHGGQDGSRPLDVDILEKDSIDWLSERESLRDYLTHIESQHSFVPRRGELVLWCVDMPEKQYLLRNMATGEYQFYDPDQQKFKGFPRWRAGVVTAVPSASSKNGTIDFPDLLDLPSKKTAMNTAGFRVETMPDTNNDLDRYLSKQYKHLPLRQIRPLTHWRLLLAGIPQGELHHSILYALTCMTSISVVEKNRLIGHWKEGGYLNAKACYLGSELITLGDSIRLAPVYPGAPCEDILVVDAIRLQMSGFQPEHIQFDSPLLCSQTSVHFSGRAFTLDKTRAYQDPGSSQDPTSQDSVRVVHPEDLKEYCRPVGTAMYGDWYLLHSMDMKMEVSYDQVLGRLYEAEAIRLYSGQRQHKQTASANPDLNFDTESILAGRRYATKADLRIPEIPENDTLGIRWVLSDHRAQALAVATMNGLEVTAYQENRTAKTLAEWRAHVAISLGETPAQVVQKIKRAPPKYRGWFEDVDMSQEASQANQGKTYSGKRKGRPPGSKIINGKLYTAAMLANMTNVPVGSKDASEDVEVEDLEEADDAEEDELAEIAETQPTFKRSSQMAAAGAQIDTTDDEDEPMNEDDDDEDEDENSDQGRHLGSGYRRPFQSRLAAYGLDDADELDDGGNGMAEFEDSWDPSFKGKAPIRPPPSKTAIMQSVEEGHDSALENVQYGEETDDDEEEFDLAAWQDPKNARGGTEESEGGDYMPGES